MKDAQNAVEEREQQLQITIEDSRDQFRTLNTKYQDLQQLTPELQKSSPLPISSASNPPPELRALSRASCCDASEAFNLLQTL
jgi:hypothetical protein